MKGLPLAYNRDLQEDKEPLFDAVATAEGALTVFERIMATLEVDASRMRDAITPELLTTDLAFYLVNKDVPFREAHEVVGALVHRTLAQGRSVGSLSTGELRAAHPAFGQDALDALDPERAVEARDSEGGTSRRAVLAQIAAGRALVGSDDPDGA
jgi:argininosuccinate lyase